jgi:transporter family protein
VSWLWYALLSAIAAAATAILAKVGVRDVDSNLATAIRTVVIIVFAWGIVLATGAHHEIGHITGRSYLFLGLSGVTTGLSWLFYFRALQLGDASRVAPVDKLSIILTVVFAAVFLGEHVSPGIAVGAVLILIGTLLVALG